MRRDVIDDFILAAILIVALLALLPAVVIQ